MALISETSITPSCGCLPYGMYLPNNSPQTSLHLKTVSKPPPLSPLHTPHLEPDIKIHLPHKPAILRPPVPRRIHKLDLEPPQETRHELVHLQRADVAADARPRPGPEVEHGRSHRLQFGLAVTLLLAFFVVVVGCKPSLRPERVDVLSKHLGAAVQHPRVAADDRASGDVLVADGGAGGWDVAFEEEADGGEEAEGFGDDGVEVGEFLSVWEGDEAGGGGVDGAGGDGGVEFGEEDGEAARVAEQVVEDGGEGHGGGVGAGEDEGGGGCQDLEVGHEVWVGGLRGGEAGEEVDALLLVGAVDVLLAVFECLQLGAPLGAAVLCEFGDGGGGVPETETSEEQLDGVFVQEQPVEPGLLADLVECKRLMGA